MTIAEVQTLVGKARKVPGRKPNGQAPTELQLTWPKDYGRVRAPKTIVGKLLGAGTLASIYGPSNAGKSTLALDIALAVATNRPWRGRRTCGGLSLYLGLESAPGLRRRVVAYQLRHKLPPVARFCDIGESVQFLSGSDLERVLAAVRQAEAEAGCPCVLIVVDTLARAMAGHDENATADMGAFVAACDRLRHETGATVLIVHHSGKDPTKGARGSGSLRAALDTEIEVSGDANPRQARVSKQRDLPSGDVFAFDLDAVDIGIDPETGETITACVVVHRDDVHALPAAAPKGKAVASILRALRNQQAESKDRLIWSLDDLRQIGRNLGQHRNTARDAVDRLIVSGLTVPTIGGHRLAEAEHERT